MQDEDRNYFRLTEAADIVARLIRDVEDFKLLAAVVIEVVASRKPMRASNRAQLAKGGKVPRFAREVYCDQDDDPPDFTVTVNLEEWANLSDSQKVALMDHALGHFGYESEDGSTWIKGHDIEEFLGTMQRRGLWSESVRQASEVLQPHLPGTAPEAAPPKAKHGGVKVGKQTPAEAASPKPTKMKAPTEKEAKAAFAAG